jgi:hypothetical protein
MGTKGSLSLEVERQGREADHSSPSSAEVKECVELYLHSPNTPSWRGAQLKHRDNFTFTLTYDDLSTQNMKTILNSQKVNVKKEYVVAYFTVISWY